MSGYSLVIILVWNITFVFTWKDKNRISIQKYYNFRKYLLFHICHDICKPFLGTFVFLLLDYFYYYHSHQIMQILQKWEQGYVLGYMVILYLCFCHSTPTEQSWLLLYCFNALIISKTSESNANKQSCSSHLKNCHLVPCHP